MPQDLKGVLLERANPQLDAERALMRLSGTFPDAYKQQAVAAPRFLDFLGANAATHPLAPGKILFHPDYNRGPDMDANLAHELGHVQQMSGKSTVQQLYDLITNRDANEDAAEKGTKQYMARRRTTDIPLPQ